MFIVSAEQRVQNAMEQHTHFSRLRMEIKRLISFRFWKKRIKRYLQSLLNWVENLTMVARDSAIVQKAMMVPEESSSQDLVVGVQVLAAGARAPVADTAEVVAEAAEAEAEAVEAEAVVTVAGAAIITVTDHQIIPPVPAITEAVPVITIAETAVLLVTTARAELEVVSTTSSSNNNRAGVNNKTRKPPPDKDKPKGLTSGVNKRSSHNSGNSPLKREASNSIPIRTFEVFESSDESKVLFHPRESILIFYMKRVY